MLMLNEDCGLYILSECYAVLIYRSEAFERHLSIVQAQTYFDRDVWFDKDAVQHSQVPALIARGHGERM